MYCPFCQAHDTKVVDSRLVTEGAQVRRRRQCLHCNERFTTFEKIELLMPMVIKRDGRRESFSIDNLRSGMLRALEKRPVSADDIEAALNNVVELIRKKGDRELDSRLIGGWVMDQLYRLDHVAYVRFASVYKRFEDLSDFRQAIDQMGSKDS